MALILAPQFIQALNTHTAQGDRLAMSGLIYRPGIGSLSGAAGLALVRAQASPNMTLLVAKERYYIAGTENANQGAYHEYNDADITVTVTASHPTLPRIDIVVVNIRDAFYSGVNNDAQCQVIAGVANASPVAPAPPVNAIVLANIAVAAAVTSINNGNITNFPIRASMMGGIHPVQTSTERNALSPLYEGLYVDRADINTLERYNGASWDSHVPASSIGYNSTAATLSPSSGVDTAITNWSTVLQNIGDIAYAAGIFTVGSAGVYRWTLTVQWPAAAAAWRAYIFAFINGSASVRGRQSTQRDNPEGLLYQTTTFEEQLSAGGTIQFGINASTAGVTGVQPQSCSVTRAA